MILGIDPGLNNGGYAVIEKNKENKFILNDFGLLCKVSKTADDTVKILSVYKTIQQKIVENDINEISYEKIFYNPEKARGGFPVQQIIGIIKLLAAQYKIELITFTPQQIKKAITGSGRAEKITVTENAMDYVNCKYLLLPDKKGDLIKFSPEKLIKDKKDHIGDAIAAALSVFLYAKPVKKEGKKEKNVQKK